MPFYRESSQPRDWIQVFRLQVDSLPAEPAGKPSLSPRVCPSSCSLRKWCCPGVSFYDILFSFCLLSFPASETLPMSCLFTSYNQNTGVSASASVLPVNIQGWPSLSIGWFDLLAVQWTFRSLLQYHSSKASILWCFTFFMVQLSQPYMTTGKTIAFTIQTISLLCIMVHMSIIIRSKI